MGTEISDDELLGRVQDLGSQFPPDSVEARTFWGAQFDLGLAWPSFPSGCGGLGAAPRQQALVSKALRDLGAPTNFPLNPIGLGMVAPVLVALGSERQTDRYLRPLFVCDEIWSQLFSEPGAGSDLADLSTTATRVGDEWTVNGQKVWTTLAHRASYGLLLARSNPELPKHSGLTAFIVDMHAPGVLVRPLRQITGDEEFNEVFFTDVAVPDHNRIGDVGGGWSVALTTLMNERVAIAEKSGMIGGSSIARALADWEQAQPSRKTPHMRDRLAQLYIDAECARLTKVRAAANRKRGVPGPEDSVGKALSGPLSQRVAEFCLDLAGSGGTIISTYDPDEIRAAGRTRDIARAFLRSRANTIEGGTSEILKNIIGERVLGLPPEPRSDKDIPWKDIRRA